MPETDVIRTPDQRLRVFVSSAIRELATERRAVRDAVISLRLVPVLFELGARPHPPRQVYRAYLAQSQVFVGVYWQSYGWVAPGQQTSGLEDEYLLSADLPRLIYVKSPAPDREPRLARMLARIKDDADVSYQYFSGPDQLRELVENDLAVLLSERFATAGPGAAPAGGTRPGGEAPLVDEASLAGALPAPSTPLLGRRQEAAAICDLVLGEGVRLVTLTGPGGVGKTRLAVKVADRLRPDFPDGERFVDLATVQSVGLVPAAVAGGLGLSTSGSRLLADMRSYLRSRRVLLLLDNFEHVAGAGPLAAELLAAAPGLVILVTSRMRLRLTGEHEFPVAPLAVPPHGARDARKYDSVRLFAERAHAAAPGFELTGSNVEAVAEICRLVDGLPLAIELAAARIRLLPPPSLLARLGDRMGLLTGGARDMPERQQTLRNTLDWSFGLLTAGDRALFGCLGVFAGTFSLPAAEAVCGDAVAEADSGAAGAVMETLASLVDSSLVHPAHYAGTGDGEPRFRLLEIIRGYADERLRDAGRWNEQHDRHAAYFLAVAEPDGHELQGPGQLAWLDRLEAERDNLRAALSWLADTGRLDQALQLYWVSWRFWWLHGHSAELTAFGEKIAADSGRLPSNQHAEALAGAGFIFIANGENNKARTMFEQSVPLWDQVQELVGLPLEATVLGILGHLSGLRRDYAAATELLDRSHAVLRRVDSDELPRYERLQHLLTTALADNFLGQIRLGQGDYEDAARLFDGALSVARRAQDRIALLVSLYDLAISSYGHGDMTGAASYLKEGLSIAAEAGDQTTAAYYLQALAAVAESRDDPQRAVRLLAAAEAVRQARGSGWLHAYVPRVPGGDASLAALRNGMGYAAFEEAWDWGTSTGAGQAIDFALSGDGPA